MAVQERCALRAASIAARVGARFAPCCERPASCFEAMARAAGHVAVSRACTCIVCASPASTFTPEVTAAVGDFKTGEGARSHAGRSCGVDGGRLSDGFCCVYTWLRAAQGSRRTCCTGKLTAPAIVRCAAKVGRFPYTRHGMMNGPWMQNILRRAAVHITCCAGLQDAIAACQRAMPRLSGGSQSWRSFCTQLARREPGSSAAQSRQGIHCTC
jgi:hypothetical protein